VRAVRAGATILRCSSVEPGAPLVEVPVVIAPVLVATQAPPIPRGAQTSVHLTLASVAPIGESLDVTAGDDVDIGDVQRTPMGLDVQIRPRGAARTITVAVASDGFTLGEAEIAVAEPRRAPAATEAPAWFALEAAAMFGIFAPPSIGASASFLGRPTQHADTLTTGPSFGGRIGLYPLPRVGVESELALALPGYAGRDGTSALAIARAQLAARVVEDDRFGLRLLAGADLLGVLVERGTSHRGATGAAHYGAAFTIETRRDLWLRLQALDTITSAQDAGYAHCFELQIGLVTRFGRRDRWW